MKVKDVMQTKVITVPMNTEIREIARTLYENNISGVPVVDESGNLVGIVSEGDLLHKKANPKLPGVVSILGEFIYYSGVKQYEYDLKKLFALKASEIMTTDVLTVAPDAPIEEAASLMVDHEIKRLPVLKDGKIIGIISRTDMMKTLIIDE